VLASVETLINKGAPYVFVANMYPKHIAPVTAVYLCSGYNNACVETFGQIISNANAALKEKLAAAYPHKVIYYDSFEYISGLIKNKNSYGFTKSLEVFCDGDGDASWNNCMVEGHAREYFWMNFVQPTTAVHKLIGQNMKLAIDKHFGFA